MSDSVQEIDVCKFIRLLPEVFFSNPPQGPALTFSKNQQKPSKAKMQIIKIKPSLN